MRIKSLAFRNVGPFGTKGVRLDGFTPELNVVCETNEFGKSTVLKSLEMLLFKPFSSADRQIKALRTANVEEGPEGEITFSNQGKTYRFTKRFLKSKGACLQDVLTDEEIAIDRAAEEAMATLLRSDKFEGGPSGLLWVRQGMSMDGIKDNGQVASRLEGELGTLVGGERAREYLDRVTKELSEVITKQGKPKKGGALSLAQEAVDTTEKELAKAKHLRDQTRSFGVDLEKVEAEILRLTREGEDTDVLQEIASTREDIVQARQYSDALALLEARQAQTVATAERAEARQAEHIAALVSYHETVERLQKTDADIADEMSKLQALELKRSDIRVSIAAYEDQQNALSQARRKRETLGLKRQRLDALQKELQHLHSLLEQLTTLEDEQAKLTDTLSDLPLISRMDIDSLRRVEADIQHYEAALSAVSTRLYFDMSKAGQGRVTLAGKVLETGPVELSGGQSLLIDGIGELRSDDSRLRETTHNRDMAKEKYADLLARFGVSNLTEAIKSADQRQALETDRKRVTADMLRLAPEGRAALEIDFNRAETEARDVADTLEMAEPDLDMADDTDMLERLRAGRAKLDVTDEALTKLRKTLSDLETEQARLRERLSGLNLSLDETERQAEADKLAGEKLKADSNLRAMANEVSALKTQAPNQSLDMLSARLTRLERVANQSREQLESLKTKAAALRARRDAAFEGEDAEATMSSLEDRVASQRDELARQVRAKDVRILLRDTLIETQTRLREAYTAPVTQELAPLLSRVIPGAEAGLGESLGVDTVLRDGKVEKIGQLSGGTQEQFAILTRLAYARLLARSGASAPVILDDALVYADDARRDAMFDVLGLVSSGEQPIQIIYLSCHAGATNRLGGTRIIPQPW